jgi:hypothetical protein
MWTGSILNSYCRYTSADAFQFFLCAFVVSLPTTTTLKIAYEVKGKALESEMQELLDVLSKVGPDFVTQKDGMVIRKVED